MDSEDIEQDMRFQDMISEMRLLEERGILLYLGNKVSTPWEIATSCIRDGFSYMRDYDIDEDGNVLKVGFDRIR